jgi:unsaturated chondroitin disaccharide hydrolase
MKSHPFLRTIVPAAAILLAVPPAVAGDALMERMPQVFARAALQYEHMLQEVEKDPQLPRTLGADGRVRTVKPEDWTSGFFPGNLWLLHEYDQSPKWKEKAWAYTRRLEVIRHFKGNHDGGFMLGCSYGNALRLDPSDESRAVLRDAAAALGTRYIPALGLIRSWDHGSYTCPVIIDNMMNLELLSWAARNGGEARLGEIARSHADRTMRNHFRPDGSAYHILDYDPKTGWIRAIHGGQGADVRTPWARGQAWALYGFTMMFRETGNPAYLERAEKLARFLMAHPHMPADRVPTWDFGIAAGAGVPRDASAAAVMASGLLELSQLARDGAAYKDYAVQQLLALSTAPYLAEPGTNGGFLLTQSTGHLPNGIEINVPLVYADYYFLEALLRYRAIVTGRKRLSLGEVH